MVTLQGKRVSGGVALGKLAFYKIPRQQIRQYSVADSKQEEQKFDYARIQALSELKQLYELALQRVGEEEALIFLIHQTMLEDFTYRDLVLNKIRDEKVNVEYAVSFAQGQLREVFSQIDDPYLYARIADVEDITRRILSILYGDCQAKVQVNEPSILAADSLPPSLVIQLDPNKVLGIAIGKGFSHSHAAILAQAMHIPSISGLGKGLCDGYDGKPAVLDGNAGVLYIEPEPDVFKSLGLEACRDATSP